MKIESSSFPPEVSCKFLTGHIYMNRKNSDTTNIFIAVRVDGSDVLVDLKNGNIWSMEAPFGSMSSISGAGNWRDVTDHYKIVSIKE